MEVFVRDSKFDLRNILSNVGLSKDTKIIIEDIYFLSTKPFGQSNNTILASCSKAEVKMIDQHDLEIRADERKKVCEELKKLKEYEKIGTLKEFKELYKIKTTDYIHRGEGVTERDYYYYTNGAQLVLDEVEQLKKENEELKSAQNKLAIEKLEKVLDFIYSNKWTNIELCVDNSPLKIIRNKLDTMLAELKGGNDE